MNRPNKATKSMYPWMEGERVQPVEIMRKAQVCLDKNPLDTTSKLSNPKDLIGSDKLPIHLWPTTATALGCLGLLDGMLKYGRTNWRVVGARYTIYIDALLRHTMALLEGEDDDPDSGLPHLSHILACAAIIADAGAAGKLHDDRMTPGGYRAHVKELTPHVARLKAMHKDKHPKHYTIKRVVETP